MKTAKRPSSIGCQWVGETMQLILVRRRMLLLQAGGFLVLIAVLWMNEVLDLPHRLFGAAATPVNWVEGLIESALVLACAALVTAPSHRLLRRLRLRLLQGILPVCANCHRIRDERGRWERIESYVRDHSEAEFSHGICPDCMRVLYPEIPASPQGPDPASPTIGPGGC